MSASLLAFIDQRLNSIINRNFQLDLSFEEIIEKYPNVINVTYYTGSSSNINYDSIYYKSGFSDCKLGTGHKYVSGDIKAFIDAFKNKDQSSGSDVNYDRTTITYTYKGHSIRFG